MLARYSISGHYRLHTSTYTMRNTIPFSPPPSSLFLHSSIEHHRRRHGCRPLSLSAALGGKEKAKYPSFHTSCLTFIQAVTKVKRLNTNLLFFFFKSNITLIQWYYRRLHSSLPFLIPVRMGENLSSHPESKEAGSSSIMSVCPLLASDVA